MQNLKFAFSSIMAHKMRSFLTMIGIIIGVSSVVVIMALGDSMSRQVNKNMTKSQKNIHVFFSPIKSKDGSFTQKQSALTVSGKEEEVPVEPPNRKKLGSRRQPNSRVWTVLCNQLNEYHLIL